MLDDLTMIVPESTNRPAPPTAQPTFVVGGRLFRYLALDVTMPALPELTQAEQAVAELVAEGLENAAIASQRGTSIHTVGNQLASIFGKLGIGSRFELAELVARRASDEGGTR